MTTMLSFVVKNKSIICFRIIISLVMAFICSCSSENSISKEYFFGRDGVDTLILFPTNEIIILRNGESHYLNPLILEAPKKYEKYRSKNQIPVILSEYGSPRRMYDGYMWLGINPLDGTRKEFDYIKLTIFNPSLFFNEESDIYQKVFFAYKYTENDKEIAKAILSKERDFSKTILRVDGFD